KRYTTETKIRILREAQSSDKTIQDVCRERLIELPKLVQCIR
ncbi:MAG: transposase, partial [Planctomycetaceae bacterium]|nr:transposase [Planctomycetaceae bacterium]